MNHSIGSIAKAIHFIEANLREELAVEAVAAQAALYSPFHFIRLFRILTGETPGGYLRKRRLSAAARDLVETKQSVLQIALNYRFRSAEAFARSFKHQFGLSPTQHRRERSFLHLVDPVQTEQLGARAGAGTDPAPAPHFFDRGPLHFTGLAYHGDAAGNELATVWAQFGAILPRVARQTKPALICGIWEYPRNFQDGRDFDYTAAVEVECCEPLLPGLSKKTLPPNRYAAFTHTGPLRLIRQTYVYIYAEWLPNSGCEQAWPYDLEVYDHRFSGPDDADSALDIVIPIRA